MPPATCPVATLDGNDLDIFVGPFRLLPEHRTGFS
jgi:hypothetical protein